MVCIEFSKLGFRGFESALSSPSKSVKVIENGDFIVFDSFHAGRMCYKKCFLCEKSRHEGKKKATQMSDWKIQWWSMEAKNKFPLTLGAFSNTRIS